MSAHAGIVVLAEAAVAGRSVVGGKAAVLAELSTAGFDVPPGFVVTGAPPDDLLEAARRLGGGRFAVRSSAAAEDLPGASYAGLYESYLDVPVEGLAAAVRRCFAAAGSERVRAYHRRGGVKAGPMAVLVQAMVDPLAAGVAFSAHPVTGDRGQAVVTAVAGLAEALVAGEAAGEEWTIGAGDPRLTRPGPAAAAVLTPQQAAAVAALAVRVADRYRCPQDIEWAIDRQHRLWLLQARPMTALPEPVSWSPPGPGLWMRNFRLGEWLPEAVSPLFATWLLPALEDGYLDGMQASLGVRVPFRYALINGWYYTAPPPPSPALLARVLRQGRSRAVKTLFNALIRVNRDPAGADRAVLSGLHRQWRDQQLPHYRQLVAAADLETADPWTADAGMLVRIVDQLAHEAGIHLWYLAIVGGSAWKMEACLTRFVRTHLATVLPDSEGGAQLLLRGLPGAQPRPAEHAVQSLDWFHRLGSELPPIAADPAAEGRYAVLSGQRAAAQQRSAAALAGRPRLLHRFRQLVEVNQRYAVIREGQARDFTLAWPVLRRCAHRLGAHLTGTGAIDQPGDVFFCTRDELQAALTGHPVPLAAEVSGRRAVWGRQRRLAAPLTLGQAPRLIGDVIERAVRQARGPVEAGDGVLVGHPASAGHATGPVRVVHGAADFAGFAAGDVLVAKATAPAWTPLFAHAAAVVTDGGTLAAHASLVAREYGIPAVVGTGDATRRLRTGQVVTVDGTKGTVTVQTR